MKKPEKTVDEKKKSETIQKLIKAFNGKPKTWKELKKTLPKATLSRILRELVKKEIVIPTVQVNDDGSVEVVYLPPKYIPVELSKPLGFIRKIEDQGDKVAVEEVEVIGEKRRYARRLKAKKSQEMISKIVFELLQKNNQILPRVIKIPFGEYYLCFTPDKDLPSSSEPK